MNIKSLFLIMMMISMANCVEVAKKTKILPNPIKVYEDQCYVSDNPKSMFYSRHYVGQTVVLFKPEQPDDCKQWVLAGTGKHRGIRAEGVWHWHWSENGNWLQPENPPGYDYPNAVESNYQYPVETEGQPEEKTGFDHYNIT